jgi:hypothetical protein
MNSKLSKSITFDLEGFKNEVFGKLKDKTFEHVDKELTTLLKADSAQILEKVIYDDQIDEIRMMPWNIDEKAEGIINRLKNDIKLNIILKHYWKLESERKSQESS